MTKKELEARIEILEEELNKAYDDMEIAELDADVRKAVKMTMSIIKAFEDEGLQPAYAITMAKALLEYGAAK